MSDMHPPPFTGSRFVRWSLIPITVLCALALPFCIRTWNLRSLAVLLVLEGLFLLLVLAVGWPARFRWAARVLSAGVFLSTAGYLIDELITRPEGIWPSDSKPERSALHAVRVLLAIGLPSLWYAIRGRMGFGKASTGDSAKGALSPPDDRSSDAR